MPRIADIYYVGGPYDGGVAKANLDACARSGKLKVLHVTSVCKHYYEAAIDIEPWETGPVEVFHVSTEVEKRPV